MTDRPDRPRVWTLHEGRPSYMPPIEHEGAVVAVEWDREKVLPIIEAALRDFADFADHLEWHQAEAIFDALDREQT